MAGAQSLQHRLTWAEYRSWDDDARWELIDGAPYCMSPAPSSRHQAIVGDLFACLREHLQGGRCRPFVSPIDVKLSDQDVVQPDLAVICDPQ